jgi:Uma2 family endonuclease
MNTTTGSLTDVAQLDPEGYYTYQDYLNWTFPERVELIRGTPYLMSPAPNSQHQSISSALVAFLFFYFKGSKCRVFSAPFDVRLPISLKPGKVDTVVQPDISIICDPAKIDKQGCNGAPDLVIEILSPGNSPHEMQEKFDLYELSKVKEYWLILPESESVLVYTLNENNKYIGHRPRSSNESLTSFIFPSLSLQLIEIFDYFEEE